MSVINLIEESTTEITLAITDLNADHDAKEELIALVNKAMESIITAMSKKPVKATMTKPKKNKKIKKAGTARSFYATETRTRLKIEGLAGKAITSAIRSGWNALSKAEKAKYVKMSEDDKVRYESETSASGIVVSKPVRGTTLYLCYSKLHRDEVIAKGFKGRAVMKELSSMWKKFKSVPNVKDTAEWKELEELKKRLDDEKLPKATVVQAEVIAKESEECKESEEEYQKRMKSYEDEPHGFLPQDLWDKEVSKGNASEASKNNYDNVQDPVSETGQQVLNRIKEIRAEDKPDYDLDEVQNENDDMTDWDYETLDEIKIEEYDIPIQKMKKGRVQEELREFDIPTTGNVRDLRNRLLKASGLDMPYAFDKLNIPNADGVVEYPSPTADYDYGSILKIPTDKNALRSLFKQHGTRIRNMNEAVEIIRRTTGCPRSLLRRPEEVEKIKSFLVSYHNKFMSKRVRNLQR